MTTELTKIEARQGKEIKYMPLVLSGSVALAVIAMIALYGAGVL